MYALDFSFLHQNHLDTAAAFCIEDHFYSYQLLKKRVNALARELINMGMRKQKIGILIEDHLDTYAAFLACWITGNAYIPIHSGYPENRIQDIEEQAGIALYFGIKNNIHFRTDKEYKNTTEFEDCLDSLPMYKHGDEDIMYVLFTSGSTGKPKGVQISYQNLSSFMFHVEQMNLGLGEGNGFLQMFELSFDLSVVSYLYPLQVGGIVYTVSPKQVKYLEIYRLMETYSLDFAIIVPSVLALLSPYFEDIELKSAKVIALSGEAVPLELTQKFQICCPNAQFYNFYGPTECTIFCTAYQIPRIDIASQNGIVSIGYPTQSLEAHLCDDEGNKVQDKGILHLSGAQVSPGYCGNNLQQNQLFYKKNEQQSYNTGDLVSTDSSGLLYYLGRKDQQIKIQGYRIELMEVEHLCKKALDRDAAVIASKDKNGYDIMVLFTRKADSIPQYDDLKVLLPSYMIPSLFLRVDQFPLNENGKLDRKTLKLNYENGDYAN
jgi:D-alanine--poly(phosphoribitol) ligase subunit 1